ncbi:MAG: DUF2892 domain-containing protein [Anaeromyxobacteraceae bacterium]
MTIDGTASRVIRVVVGLGLVSLAVAGPHSPWGWVGLAPLLTGLTGFCPVCHIPGAKTACRIPAK